MLVLVSIAQSPATVRRLRGFSLIELLLVLGVIAVLLVAAFVIYPQVRARNQANTEVTNVRAIQANVRNLYAVRGGNYYGIGAGPGTSDYGIGNQARIFPATMNGGDFSANVPITSSWGGEVYVWNRPAIVTPYGNVASGRSFGIAYFKVPTDVCVPMVTALSESFLSIAVGAAGAQTEVLVANQGLNVPRLTAACQAQDVNITFTSN